MKFANAVSSTPNAIEVKNFLLSETFCQFKKLLNLFKNKIFEVKLETDFRNFPK